MKFTGRSVQEGDRQRRVSVEYRCWPRENVRRRETFWSLDQWNISKSGRWEWACRRLLRKC